MKIEQKVNLLYAVMGILVGLASKIFQSWLEIAVALAVYAVSFVLVRKLVRTKTKWIISNSAASFFLMWLVVWIILVNL